MSTNKLAGQVSAVIIGLCLASALGAQAGTIVRTDSLTAFGEAIHAIPSSLPAGFQEQVENFLAAPQPDRDRFSLEIGELAKSQALELKAPKPTRQSVSPDIFSERFVSIARENPLEANLRLETLDLILSQRLPTEKIIAITAAAHQAKSLLSKEQEHQLTRHMIGIAAKLGLPGCEDDADRPPPSWQDKRQTIYPRLAPPRPEPSIKFKMQDGRIKTLSSARFQQLFGVRYAPVMRVPIELPRSLTRSTFMRKDYSKSKPPPKREAQLASGIRHGRTADVYIARVSPKVGYGAFAGSDIKEGDPIGAYTGVLTVKPRFGRSSYLDNNMYTMFYPYGSDGGYSLTIDAKLEGNITRFINHSYEPNVDVITIFASRLYNRVLVATKHISKDAQLLIDYGGDYWFFHGITPEELH